ncbi:esterase/lipase family protein [Nocardia blacklockiae]|uniref:esterase/lipase family protein n=1 Tax=Nocardia blacklockiae TaxID=480036 RepID=UPI001892ED41|nr:alpha/beta fold hydrolase [Nocardia blacklockiae]MBF6170375.1 alpha/beta fold hydrolase [Nocardia blacklockiae]
MGQRSRRRVREVPQWWRIAVTGVLVGALALGPGASTADPPAPGGYRPPVVPTDPGPPQPEHMTAAWYTKTHPSATPAGTNDFACRPGPDHPRPVVLAHGTDASAYTDWAAVGPVLARAGYCVFAVNYGGRPDAIRDFGTEDMWLSARQIGEFVDRVRAATGAPQVDLVGFSQGANVTRYYVNKLGGAPAVGQWIGLASPSYGGVMYGLVPLADAIPGLWWAFEQVTSSAAVQQAAGSPFMRALNAGGDTVPGVRYTTIGSRVDEMIQPNENMALRGPGAVNILLQDTCPVDLTGHFHLVYDPLVWQLLLNALDPAHARAPECRFVPLGTGIPEVILGAHT